MILGKTSNLCLLMIMWLMTEYIFNLLYSLIDNFFLTEILGYKLNYSFLL